MNERLYNILEKFRKRSILVIGDIILDKYVWGSVSRISPEAPVQIVNVQKENYLPGGAANVASNTSSLKAKTYMMGIVGKDNTRDILLSELRKRNIDTNGILTVNKKLTIQKVRILGQNQQLIRVDYEKKGDVDKNTEKNIIKKVSKIINKVDAIVISDYAKGVITKYTAEKIIETARKKNKIIIVDPKPEHKNYYKNVDLITPNYMEASIMANIEQEGENIIRMGNKLLEELNSTLLITKGEKGMSLFEKDGKITEISTKAKEVYDVTGAGDTVVAVVALALASGATIKEAAILANHAAGIVVGKLGTSTTTVNEIKKSLENE